MDFGALPPEVNAARMYAGPGSAPMMAAASAWNGLAAELGATAAGYDAVIKTLSGEEWLGPAAAAMATAVIPYVAWLSATAGQAQQAAKQATAAAAAFETAFSSMVPPPVIAANRAQLSSLVSTNLLGLNAPAIAANQTQYGEMWAQAAMTMYAYAGSSASAAAVTPFAPPPQTTNPAGAAGQAAAVTQAAGTAAGTALAQLLSALPSALQGLSTPISSIFNAAGASSIPSWLQAFLTWYVPVSQLIYNTTGLPYFGIGIGNSLIGSARALGMIGPQAAEAAAGAAAAAAPAAASAAGALGGGGPVAASLASANSIGKLSVPPTWAPSAAAPAAVPGALRQIDQIVEAPETAAAGNLLGGMPLAGAGAGTAGSGPRYGFRPTVMARPPFAG
ncbi:PPE family protein [Mycobacterium angelicum]|uniref:PPE family protein n=1 Tax=Mycobacterium angelicum TaxID=470074 RepID=A0A1W9ZQX6_MYCAN|nr:PPE family protein [Mycobacterium angelicum]MCV7198864.1 PPE family protein [Mycobacterium angelicum]ORA20214.1 hypothetical protein BST12_15710 [Mycobacterium angelicum]